MRKFGNQGVRHQGFSLIFIDFEASKENFIQAELLMVYQNDI